MFACEVILEHLEGGGQNRGQIQLDCAAR